LSGLRKVAQQIRCIQVDPISHVSRTEHLVLFSRLGPDYKRDLLAKATYEKKELFHYFAHAASLVLTEDYPIHSFEMRTWPRSKGVRADRVKQFMKDNDAMRRRILKRLREEGPLRARDFEFRTSNLWESDGWTHGQNVGRMLDFLWIKGRITIVGRRGLDRVWGLADEWFPEWTPRERWPESKVVEESVRRSLGALGLATRKQISLHFTRWVYPNLPQVLKRMVASGEVVVAEVHERGTAWPGQWYVLASNVALLEKLKEDDLEPRTMLLSPFDNLICDRDRTLQLFNFHYRIEIYVPKAKRQYGYYVLPILHGDRLIGRVDSRFDKAQKVYAVDNVYVEPGASKDKTTGRSVREALESMAQWLGAESVIVANSEAWASILRR
jgi:uncharacterized protein YcaQ